MIAGYYRAWRDVANGIEDNVIALDEVSDALDYVAIIVDNTVTEKFLQRLPSYIESLHKKGIKVLRTLFVDVLYRENYCDCGKVIEFKAHSQDFSSSDVKNRVDRIINEYLQPFDFDGLIIDVDHDPVKHDADYAAAVFNILPQRWQTVTEKNHVIVFDQDVLLPITTFIAKVHPVVTYYFADTYGMDLRRIQGLYEQVSQYVRPEQFVPGFSFYEERGPRWGDIQPDWESSRANELVGWNPDCGIKGGVFAYAIDRDGLLEGNDRVVATSFPILNHIASLMNQ